MNKKLIILTALMLATSYQGLVVLDASAGPGDFTTMWVINLPRATYFIGESVTFTVVAFASSDPSILLPDQMAKITIRNSSMAQVYEAWVTTNVNGSAPVTWESGLDAYAGNYTIILDDLSGKKVIAEFMLLYNEETFWQTKVDLLEREVESQYSYINYLFSVQKYQQKKLREIERKMTIFGGLAFVTVMCALYVGMHEVAMSRRTSTGIMSLPGKALDLIFRKNPIELEHEIIADARVPFEKRVPVYGHDHFCPVCDPDKKQPMTENMLRDHLWAVHDRLHLKTDSILAKWRARKAKSIAKAQKKANEPIEPAFATVEKYQEEWAEENIKQKFQARLNLIKNDLRKKKITQAEAKAKVAQLREDLKKANAAKATTEVLKQTTAPKPEVARKARTERLHLAIPKASDENPTKIPDSRTAIDELFDKLSNEKVNR